MWKVIISVLVLIGVSVVLTVYRTPSKKVEPVKQNKIGAETQRPTFEIIAQNLEVPWALAFLPFDSTQGKPDILVTERVGRVKLINKDGQVKQVAEINVEQEVESGLHGIAIDPKFSQNHYVYLYYAYSSAGNNIFNRVSKFTFDDPSDGRLKDEQFIVDKIPGATTHDGGRIKFGPDDFLYITTGDAVNPSLSQDKNSLAGKILRVKDDDKLEVYSYGHRNPQGITWDDKGRLWETEHGSSATDEINLLEMGKNYGWPQIRGDQKQQGMSSPILHSGQDTWAPAGASFYNGSIYFGGLRGQALYQFDIQTKELKAHFKGQFGRIRDVVLSPDNMLYITTSNRDGRGSPTSDDDKVIKINPEKL